MSASAVPPLEGDILKSTPLVANTLLRRPLLDTGLGFPWQNKKKQAKPRIKSGPT
jgi:hypothetical protein